MTADASNPHFPAFDHLPLAEFLDALDGTAYLTDLEGRLVAVGRTNWRGFATENAGGTLAETPPIGRSLEQLVSGETVRSFYRKAHQVAVSGGRRIAFVFRCDAPDVERRMKMAIGPLRMRERIVGVLYQSTVLSERSRPPIRFLDVSAALEQYKEDVAPLIVSCSFCSKVDWPAGSGGPWVIPEDYYRLGGVSEVRISHGVCPDCAESMTELIS